MKKFSLLSIFGLFFLLVLTVYGNSLNNPFMIDDYFLILNDEKIHNLNNIFLQFIPDKGRYLGIEEGVGELYYRPFAHILPMIAYSLFQTNVFGYHVMNVLLFTITLISLFVFIRAVTHQNNELAMISTLIYAVHPLNGLYVNYVTASVFAMQVTMLSLSGFLFLRFPSWPSRTLSLGCFLLALLCHETSLSLPLFIFILAYYWFRFSLKTSLRASAPYFILAGFFVLFRIKFASLNTSLFEKIYAYQMNIGQFIATYTKLICWYLGNFINPSSIVMIWTTPVMTVQLTGWILGFTVFSLCAAALLFINKIPLNYRIGGLWFFIGILPIIVGCIFQPATGLMIEPHWLFFGSGGLFLLLAGIITHLNKILKLISVFTLLIFYSIGSIQMNNLWGNEVEYCKFWYQQSPQLKSALYYLAYSYERQHKIQEAKETYLAALENGIGDWQIYNNLGLIAQNERKFDQAITYYEKALTIKPKSAIVYNNLGSLYKFTSRIEQAQQFFNRATLLNPYLLEPRANLAAIYIDQRDYQKANDLIAKNLDLNPNSEISLLIALKIELREKDIVPEAKRIVKKLLKSSNPKTIEESANVCLTFDKFYYAILFYEKLLKLQPQNIQAHINLGKIYGNFNQFDRAIAIWNFALQQDPTNTEISALINQAKTLSAQTDK